MDIEKVIKVFQNIDEKECEAIIEYLEGLLCQWKTLLIIKRMNEKCPISESTIREPGSNGSDKRKDVWSKSKEYRSRITDILKDNKEGLPSIVIADAMGVDRQVINQHLKYFKDKVYKELEGRLWILLENY